LLINKDLADFYMEKYGLDAIIATQPVSVKYFSGFECWLGDYSEEWMGKPGGSKSSMVMFCILPFKGDPILVVHKLFNPFGFSTFCKDIRLYGAFPEIPESMDLEYVPNNLSASSKFEQKYKIYSNPVEAIADALKDNNISNSNIGIETAGFNLKIKEQILQELNKCLFKDCTEMIRLIRMIKTVEEIDLITKSAELNEIAMQEAVKYLKSNTISGEHFDVFKQTVEKHNGKVEHHIFSVDGYGLNSNKNYIFKKNQIVFLDAGTYYLNYASDTGTTIFIGKSDNKYLEVFKRIYEATNIGLNIMAPGIKCSVINDRIVEYLEKYNICNTDTHGHGIGLQPSEYPIITSKVLNYNYFDGFETRDADFCLEENMIINLEIPYYIFGKGSYIIEVSALIEKGGCRSIAEQKRESPILNF
jgi:Xaa-Pro dipeptidase